MNAIFADRKARTMLAAIALYSVGFGLHLLALGLLMYQFTGSAKAFAMILTMQAVVAVCVLPFCGPLVDALESRRVYLVCSIARAAIVALIAGISVLPLPHRVPLIIAAVLALTVTDNLQRTAQFKFTAHHIHGASLVRLNGLIGVAFQAGALAGMALLGVILLVSSPSVALLVDVAAALLCALLVSRIRVRNSSENSSVLTSALLWSVLTGAGQQWLQMLRNFRSDAVVFGAIVLCAGDFLFANSLSTLVVPLVEEFYQRQTWYISALEATFGVGMIVASFLVSHTVRQRLLPLWIGAQAAAALVLSYAERPAVQFFAFAIGGFANLNSLTWLLTALQKRAADSDKAKMATLRMLAIGLGTAALMPVVGHASETSLHHGFTAIAVIMAVFALGSFWVALAFRTPPVDAGVADADDLDDATVK